MPKQTAKKTVPAPAPGPRQAVTEETPSVFYDLPDHTIKQVRINYFARPNTYLIYGFIAVNVGVWGYAAYATEQARQGNPSMIIDWYKNWTINYNRVIDEGRWWTTLTSTLAHTQIWHLGANMLSFYFLADFVAKTPGVNPLRFFGLVIGSGVAGSALFLVQRHYAVKKAPPGAIDQQQGLGFSGAVMGVSSAAACLFPTAKVQLYGIVPVPLWGLCLGYLLYDGFYLNAENSRIAHSGHLGGLSFGLLYYLLFLKRVVPKKMVWM